MDGVQTSVALTVGKTNVVAEKLAWLGCWPHTLIGAAVVPTTVATATIEDDLPLCSIMIAASAKLSKSVNGITTSTHCISSCSPFRNLSFFLSSVSVSVVHTGPGW